MLNKMPINYKSIALSSIRQETANVYKNAYKTTYRIHCFNFLASSQNIQNNIKNKRVYDKGKIQLIFNLLCKANYNFSYSLSFTPLSLSRPCLVLKSFPHPVFVPLLFQLYHTFINIILNIISFTMEGRDRVCLLDSQCH